jgi:hypothetical protein
VASLELEEESIIAFEGCPNMSKPTFALATQTELSIMEISAASDGKIQIDEISNQKFPNKLVKILAMSINFDTITKEHLQVSLIEQDSASQPAYMNQLVFNIKKRKLQQKVYSFSLMNQLPYYQALFENSLVTDLCLDAVLSIKDFEGRPLYLLQGLYEENSQILTLFSLDREQ